MNHIVAASRRLASLNPTGCPEGIEPGLWRKTLSQRIEKHLAMVETLLWLIDGMDEDCDLENIDPDLEPSLGGIELHGEVDLEADWCDLEEDDPAEEDDAPEDDDPDHGIDDIPSDDEELATSWGGNYP